MMRSLSLTQSYNLVLILFLHANFVDDSLFIHTSVNVCVDVYLYRLILYLSCV